MCKSAGGLVAFAVLFGFASGACASPPSLSSSSRSLDPPRAGLSVLLELVSRACRARRLRLCRPRTDSSSTNRARRCLDDAGARREPYQGHARSRPPYGKHVPHHLGRRARRHAHHGRHHLEERRVVRRGHVRRRELDARRVVLQCGGVVGRQPGQGQVLGVVERRGAAVDAVTRARSDLSSAHSALLSSLASFCSTAYQLAVSTRCA